MSDDVVRALALRLDALKFALDQADETVLIAQDHFMKVQHGRNLLQADYDRHIHALHVLEEMYMSGVSV